MNPQLLLAARGITTADPMELGGQGLTLARLMQQVQAAGDAQRQQQQMADLYADPAYMSALLGPQGGAMTGQGGPGMPPGGAMPPGAAPMPGAAPGGPPGAPPMPGVPGAPGGPGAASGAAPDGQVAPPRTTFADALRRNPLAAGAGVKMVMEAQKERAEVASKDAATAKATNEMVTQRIQTAGNIAADVVRNPTPQAYTGLMAQMKFAGLPADAFGTPPSVMDGPDAIRNYARTLASAATSAKDAADVARTYALLPGELTKQTDDSDKTRADTAKTQGETGLLTYNANTQRISANASATSAGAAVTNAATNRMQYDAPNLQHVGDATNGYQVFNPGARADPSKAFTAAPATTQQKLVQGANRTLDLLDQAEGLIGDATHSGIGAKLDAAAGAVGKSTKGADATAGLKPISAALMMNMPRLEGPQSDADRKLYIEAAGSLALPIPISQKRAAMATIREIATRNAGNTPRMGAPAASAGGRTMRVDDLPDPKSMPGASARSDDGVTWTSNGQDWVRGR